MTKPRLPLLTLLLFFAFTLARAEPGTVLSFEHVERYNQAQINQIMGRFFPQGRGRAAQDSVDLYRIRYVSSDEQGEPIEVIAQLYLPLREENDFLPLYVMGAGTTGMSDACAPSNEQPTVRNWGDYPAHMLSYATQGFIGIMPDPAGFHDPNRVHRYFMLEPAGQVLLDAARAVYDFLAADNYAVQPAEAVFMGGYSAGGHAIFAAADLHASYAPELPLYGVIGYGPTTDLPAMMLASPYFSPYLVYAFSQVYGTSAVDPKRVLRARFANTLEQDVLALCVDELPNYYGSNPNALYTNEFTVALRNRSFKDALSSFGELLVENSSGLRGSSVPALILQGSADTIVYPREQQRFAAQYCAGGGTVTYVPYANLDHFQTRQFGYRDTLAWMRSLIAGDAPRDDCGGF